MSGITTAEYDIQTVLQTPLASITTVAQDHIVYINDAYTNEDNASFLDAHILPSRPFQANLGTYGQQKYEGIFQINIYTPADTGIKAVSTIMSELKSVYRRGATLQNAEISVECKVAWEGTPNSDDVWYMIPFSVDYYAYVNNE